MHLLLDIEGTITDPSGREIDPQLLRALFILEEKSTPIIMCSGRDLDYMEHLRRRWGLEPLKGAIAENGCRIVPYPKGIDGVIDDERALLMDRMAMIRELEIYHGLLEIDPFKRYIVSVYVPGFLNGRNYTPEELREVHSFVKDALKDFECQIVLTSASVEVIPQGVDKGSGVLRYCQMSGITPADVIFICDSANDIPGAKMVKKKGGRVGVVANGVPELKRLADKVAGSDFSLGALELIEYFGLMED